MSSKPQATANFRLRETAQPPVYQFNLDLPPRQRHREICEAFKAELVGIQSLYDDILRELSPSSRVRSALRFLAKTFLRRVHSGEETEEIRGIAEATGVPIHLIVAYNTFLDLFSGCTSGGVKVRDPGDGKSNEPGMVHFRGLDWEMDPLRDLVICLEYVKEGKVIARAVTYAGYTGTLTGVRKGLSMSLNYRTRILSSESPWRHYLNYLAIILGKRPSISSRLRILLLSPDMLSLADLADSLSSRKCLTCPCYLTFCSSSSVLIVEKDLRTAGLHASDDFLVVTNHDRKNENSSWDDILRGNDVHDKILEDSIERRTCFKDLYASRTKKRVAVSTVRDWLLTYPVLNECTHFSCIMDPGLDGGGMLWVRVHDPIMEEVE